jgi:hypothetical protein
MNWHEWIIEKPLCFAYENANILKRLKWWIEYLWHVLKSA